MTLVCRENKIQGGFFSPSSRSHGDGKDAGPVLCRSSQAPQGAVPGAQQRVCMPATGLAPMGAGMCQALVPVPIGQVGDARGCP